MGSYVVTGGATGIGAGSVAQLRAEGHDVCVVDIKEADIQADLSSDEGCAAAVAAISERFPEGIDGLVACAGVGPFVKPHSLITKINYYGAIAIIEGLKSLLQKKRGSVVLISSNSAPMYQPQSDYVELLLDGKRDEALALIDTLDGQTAYSGSKLAVTRWMRRNTAAYARAGVRLNAVAPGIIRTPLTDAAFKDATYGQAMKDFGDSVPVGRLGEPADIAKAVSFLLSEQSAFTCGSVLFVDGGHDAMLRADRF